MIWLKVHGSLVDSHSFHTVKPQRKQTKARLRMYIYTSSIFMCGILFSNIGRILKLL